MATHLLDTDAVIDHLNGFAPTTDLLTRLVEHNDLLATNVVVIAEVYSGLSANQRERADRFVDQLLLLSIDADVAKQAGTLRFAAKQQGITLAVTDTLIAATALAHGTTVVTGNARHYPQPALTIVPLPGR